MELCKLAITSHARDYVFSKLAEIDSPECLDIILNLEPILIHKHDPKELFRDIVEKNSYYDTLSDLKSNIDSKNKEKYIDTLIQGIDLYIEEVIKNPHWPHKFPNNLKIITEFKEGSVLESLILKIHKIPFSPKNNFKEEYINIIKKMSVECNDSLLTNIHKWNLDFSKSKSGNTQIFSPDESRIIFSSLLIINEDIERLNFMLDDSFFSETNEYKISTRLFYHEECIRKLENMSSSKLSTIVKKLDVGNSWYDKPDDKVKIKWIKEKMAFSLTKNEIKLYSKVKESRNKKDLANLIKELLGSHHYIYRHYFFRN